MQQFITAAARAWVFGYWGCQVFAALPVSCRAQPIISRWFAISFLLLHGQV